MLKKIFNRENAKTTRNTAITAGVMGLFGAAYNVEQLSHVQDLANAAETIAMALVSIITAVTGLITAIRAQSACNKE